MITIDTLKLKTPLSSFNKIDRNANWMTTNKQLNGETISSKSSLHSIDLGFKSMMYNPAEENMIMEFSAKTLKSNYHSLISIDTFEQVCDSLSSTGVIDINKERLLNDATCLKVDFCNNLEMDKNVNDYFPQLLGIRANTTYKVDRYNKPKNKGVVIQGNQTSFKERQILYNKIYDIQRDKDLLAVVPYNQLEKQFKNVLRIEQNTAQFKRIKHYANTKTTNLKEVLESSSNPNLKLFEKATSKFLDLSLFNDAQYENKKLYEIEKIEGRKNIIKKCNYDFELIKEFIKSKVKGNVSQYAREYNALLIDMLVEKNFILQPEENIYVMEIIDKLKLVA